MSKCTIAVADGNITIKHYIKDDSGTCYVNSSLVRAVESADDNLLGAPLPEALDETTLSSW